jgi:hypothetical protein
LIIQTDTEEFNMINEIFFGDIVNTKHLVTDHPFIKYTIKPSVVLDVGDNKAGMSVGTAGMLLGPGGVELGNIGTNPIDKIVSVVDRWSLDKVLAAMRQSKGTWAHKEEHLNWSIEYFTDLARTHPYRKFT